VLGGPDDQGKRRGPRSGVCRGSKGVATAAEEGQSCGLSGRIRPASGASAVMATRTVCSEMFRSADTGRTSHRRSRWGSARRAWRRAKQGAALATPGARALRSAATTSTPAGHSGGGRLLPSAGGSAAAAPHPGRRARRAAGSPGPGRHCVTEPVGPRPTPPAPAARTERGRPGLRWGTTGCLPHTAGNRRGARRWGRGCRERPVPRARWGRVSGSAVPREGCGAGTVPRPRAPRRGTSGGDAPGALAFPRAARDVPRGRSTGRLPRP
jgi:hypothetical protein